MDRGRWRRIDRIFQIVAELPEAERGAVLAAECGDDRALRGEVETLLAHDAAGTPLLDQPQGITVPREVPLPVGPGDRIGAWRLGALVGEGGSGVVFEAERADERYERRVAIKFLKQALLTRDAVERFRTECRVLGRLEHPHIARLYDAAATDKGLPYIVLEWVEGIRLDEWWRSKPSLDRRLALFAQVCEAVAFAHRNLVVHRDLKPGNILVTAAGEPKLLDFGIARVLPGEEAEERRLTRTSQQPMTPQYASPEQLRGDDVTTASDVYSLGLVLYELLTGRLPYQLRQGLGKEARQLAEGERSIRPPSATAVAECPEAVPPRALRGDLDAIVLTALEADPKRRYGSAQALQQDIDRFRDGLPILARRPNLAYTLRRFVGRHRLAVAAAAALLALLVGFAVSMTLAARRLAVEKERSEAEAATARAVVGFVGGLFEGAEPAFHQGRDLTARQLLDRGAAGLAAARAQPPATRAALSAAIGKAYLDLSLLGEARRFLADSLALRQDLAEPAALAESHRLLARLEWSDSNFQQAARHAEAAADRLRHDGERVHLAEALTLLGRSRGSLGDLDGAEAALEDALAVLGPQPEHYPALAGIVFRELASVHLYRKRVDRAGELVRRAIDLLTAAHGRLHPEIFDARRLLAAQVGMSERPSEARSELSSLERLLEDQRRLYGPAHAQMVWTLVDLAGARVEAFELEEALQLYRQAREMQQQVFGDDHMTEAVIESHLGTVLWRTDQREAAVTAFERSLRVARKRVEPGSYDVAMPVLYLGKALAGVGRCPEALPLLREASTTFDEILEVPNFALISARWNSGFCRWHLGEQEAGEESMRGALAQAEERGYEDREEPEYRVEMKEWRRVLAYLDEGEPAPRIRAY